MRGDVERRPAVASRPGARDGRRPATSNPLRQLLEGYLERLTFSPDPRLGQLCDAMRSGVLAGRTRIRPVLALATAQALGRAPATVLPLAAALELIHAHGLVHAGLPAIAGGSRRGDRPPTQLVSPECTMLLAGDALLAEAFALVLREQRDEPARVVDCVVELASATGLAGAIGSQYRRIAAGADDASRERMLAAAIGAVLCLVSARPAEAAALRRFAVELGVMTRDDPRRTGARAAHARARAALQELPGDTSELARAADRLLDGGAGALR